MAPHVVAIPFPIPGHINPLLTLCKKLQSLGFKITYVNSHENHKFLFKTRAPIEQDGIQFVGIPDGLPERAEGEQPPSGMEGVKLVLQSTDGMEPAMKNLVDAMVSNPGTHPITCIISDSFIHWTQDIANKHRFPRVAFNTTSATLELVGLHMRRFRSDGFLPVNSRTTGDKLIEFIPGMPGFSPLDIPLAFFEEHPIIDFIIITFERLLEADWILYISNTFHELEAHTLGIFHNHYGFKNYLPIGPFLPDSHVFPEQNQNLDRIGLSEDDSKCLQRLDSRPAATVLYVAFGSIAILSREQSLELMAGLEACPDQAIVWSVRPNLVPDFPREEFDGFLERNKGRVHVSAWAPQMHILRHPSVGGFLTHCGWNSIMESVAAGVPMIGWPCLSEQNLNCSFLVKNKLALRLWKNGSTSLIWGGEITAAVNDLMNSEIGEILKQNVKKLRDQAREALANGGSSRSNFQAFVQAIS